MGYSPERKAAVLKRMLPPNNMAIRQLAQEDGISEAKRNNHTCGRHRVRRLMRLMRLVPIYQESNTRKKHPSIRSGSTF